MLKDDDAAYSSESKISCLYCRVIILNRGDCCSDFALYACYIEINPSI